MTLPIVPLAALAALVLFGSSSSAQASAPPEPPAPAAPRPSSAPKKKKKPSSSSSSSSSAPPMPDIAADIEAAAAIAAATLEAQTIVRPGGGKAMVMPPIDITAQVPAASPAAPHAALAPKPQPPGYNPQAARREAASLAAHLKRAGRTNYDRRMLEAWQKKAGLIPDRIYGGATRGALRFYGVADPPLAYFPPTQEIPFVPPESR